DLHSFPTRRSSDLKTTRRASSAVPSVKTTAPCDSDTMLTESGTLFTTQTSSDVRARTETGSMPTGIPWVSWGALGVDREKTDNRPASVSTASSFVPSVESRIGWTGWLSKFDQPTWGGAANARGGESTTARHGVAMRILMGGPRHERRRRDAGRG